jgi:hypothetical protein
MFTNNGVTHTVYHFDSLKEFVDNAEPLLSFTTLYIPNIDSWIRINAIQQVVVQCAVRVCLEAGLTAVHKTDPSQEIHHEVECPDLPTNSRYYE